MVASPEDLVGAMEHFAPHALVRDDDGAGTGTPDGVVCWVGILIDDHLNARIGVDGRVSEIHDVSLDEFLAALDEAEGIRSTDGDGRVEAHYSG